VGGGGGHELHVAEPKLVYELGEGQEINGKMSELPNQPEQKPVQQQESKQMPQQDQWFGVVNQFLQNLDLKQRERQESQREQQEPLLKQELVHCVFVNDYADV